MGSERPGPRGPSSLSKVDGVPSELQEIYRTSFQLSPYAFVNVAARAQKWIDQAISRNMYLETRDIDDMMDIYMGAWERGVKTTYYLHMKPRHTAEQSTVKVNKSEDASGGARKGFGSSAGAAPSTAEPVAAAAAPRKGFGFGGAK